VLENKSLIVFFSSSSTDFGFPGLDTKFPGKWLYTGYLKKQVHSPRKVPGL